MILATAAAEAPRDWDNTLGILFGLLGIYLVWRVDLYIRQRRGERDTPSPAETVAPAPREIPQVSGVSSHVSSRETPVRRSPGGVAKEWWGAISYDENGDRRRIFGGPGNASPVERPLPQSNDPVVESDPEIDLDLDDVSAGHGEAEAPADAARRETRDEYVERCFAAGVETAAIVAALQEHYGLSRATAYRVVGRTDPNGRTRAA